jgi:hypothetical protein
MFEFVSQVTPCFVNLDLNFFFSFSSSEFRSRCLRMIGQIAKIRDVGPSSPLPSRAHAPPTLRGLA